MFFLEINLNYYSSAPSCCSLVCDVVASCSCSCSLPPSIAARSEEAKDAEISSIRYWRLARVVEDCNKRMLRENDVAKKCHACPHHHNKSLLQQQPLVRRARYARVSGEQASGQRSSPPLWGIARRRRASHGAGSH